jgi:hypothetical protein
VGNLFGAVSLIPITRGPRWKEKAPRRDPPGGCYAGILAFMVRMSVHSQCASALPRRWHRLESPSSRRPRTALNY